jgi:alkaline phosphatase
MLKMKLITCVLVVIALSAACVDSIPPDHSLKPGNPPKYVFLMIADGSGYNHIVATNQYRGTSGQFESFPVRLGVSTFEFGGSYDPAFAWQNFPYMMYGATDSSSAATTLSTGIKTTNGRVGVNYNGSKILMHAMNYAEAAGFSTGVVTSVQWSHATPACFIAHNPGRDNYAEIALEMIFTSKTDVIMGCGHPMYDDNGIGKNNWFDYKYVGGKQAWSSLVSGTAGGDADGDGDNDRWTFIDSKDDFEKYASGELSAKRLCGTARVETALQQARAKKSDDVYGDPFITTVPSLATMAIAGANTLSHNPRGFIVMIEGGAVDKASHDNQLNRMIEERIEFDNAITAVISWIEKNSSWDESLLIVTSDHETGYMQGAGSDPTWEPITTNGAGSIPNMIWYSSGHSNSLVPLFAKGKGAHLLSGAITGTDPVRGKYIDNSAIGYLLVGFYK